MGRAVWRKRVPVTAGVALASIWLATLALPAYARFYAYSGGAIPPHSEQIDNGLGILLVGWLAPLAVVSPDYGQPLPPGYGAVLPFIGVGDWCAASICWFANPLFVFNIFRMIGGRRPGLASSALAALLALPALQLFYVNFGDDHGIATKTAPLIGAVAWVAVVSAPFVLRVVGMLVPSRGVSAPSLP